jgi:hypothetical protein
MQAAGGFDPLAGVPELPEGHADLLVVYHQTLDRLAAGEPA